MKPLRSPRCGEILLKKTSCGLNAEDPLYSTSYYAALFVHADALEHSRFLKTLLDDYSPLNMVRKERIERLKRR